MSYVKYLILFRRLWMHLKYKNLVMTSGFTSWFILIWYFVHTFCGFDQFKNQKWCTELFKGYLKKWKTKKSLTTKCNFKLKLQRKHWKMQLFNLIRTCISNSEMVSWHMTNCALVPLKRTALVIMLYSTISDTNWIKTF